MELHDILLSSKFASKNNENAEGVDLSSYYTKSQTDDLISAKVDKVPDMGLSESSFTNTEKTKLAGLENYNDTQIRTEMAEIAEQAAFNRSTLGYQRKNLLKNNKTTPLEIQRVTWTPNEDGTLTVNGTAFAASDYYIAGSWQSSKTVVEKGDYIISCDGLIQGTSMCVLDFSDGVTQKMYRITQSSGIRLTDVQITGIYLQLSKDTTANDLILKPMIRYASITDDTYEPYKPSVEEYIFALEERITALEESRT